MKQKKLKETIIKSLADDGKENRILFMGHTEPLPYLQISDVFLFVSEREGFGSAVIEAMACSLPVICKKIDKVTDFIITPNKTGIIIDSNDPGDFIKAVLDIYYNPSLKHKMGKDGENEAISRFSLKEITNKYLNLYNSVVKQKE